VGALLLYRATLLPDVGLWDTAEFQAIGPVLGIAHPTGYPTYTLVAWFASVVLQPLGNEAYRADLLSALAMAGAAALLAVRLVMATQRWPIGLVAGLVFALTPVAWGWGVRADPHALHVFLAALLLVLLGAWQASADRGYPRAGHWLVAAAVVYGLALGNHALTLLLAPGIAAYVLMVAPRILWRQWRVVISGFAAVAISATLVYLYLPLRSLMDPPLDYADPQTWERFWYVALGQQFGVSFGPLPPFGELLSGVWDELVLDLGPLVMLALAGLLLGLLRHPRLTLLGLLWFGSTWLFAIGYPNAAIERYYLVPLLMAALWVGLAADAMAEALGQVLAGQQAVVRRLVTALLVLVLLLPAIGAAAERYPSLDASDEDWGRVYLEATLEVLEEDAVVISWWSFSTPLWYGQHVEGRRPDVTVIDDRDILDDGYGDVASAIEAHLGRRPVYVIRLEHDREALERAFVLSRVPGVPADLYRVDGPVEQGRGRAA
jgi:4-amino-4-deoxy-L-arabinose transferase-like glycosyltransferase